uniref:PhiKZ-like internal head family protein n=1 Tax=Burkholderia phage vB_BgluM-SURPRISE13 TaxID=3159457 RepID=A0AAU7PFB8_9VIRU
MSFLPQSGILHSNENFDAADTMTGADAIAPDETNTLASAVSEINADEAAINTGNTQIDAAAVAADGLETIAEQVAEANEGEGIDENTAEIIETSVEALLKVAKIGVTYKQLGIPSSESFKSRNNRAALGKATVEALELSAKKIWQAIVDAIKKSIEWVRNFFNKIFGAAENLQRRAQKLKESTTKLSGQPEEANIENGSLFNAVRVNGQPVSAANLQELGKEGAALFKAQKDLTDKYGKVNDIGLSDLITPAPASYGLKPADAGTAKRVTAESDVAVFVTSRFPGESVVYLAMPKSESADAKGATEFAGKIKAGSVSLSEKKEEGKSLKTLGVDEIRGFAEAVEKFAGEVASYKQGLTAVNDNKSKFIAKVEKYMTGAGKDAGESKDTNEKVAKANATIFRKLMDEPAASYASHSIRAMSSALQYAELSARQYSGKE